MPAAAADILRSIVRLVWPETCAGCDTNHYTSGGFCARCNRELLFLAALEYCPRCGRTVGPGLRADKEGCFDCPSLTGRFDRLVRVGPYADPVRPAIRRMKYRRATHAVAHLARLLAEAVSAKCRGTDFDVVLPVPMYWLRRLARGWNHSAVLAKAVGAALGVPMGDELIRVRNTPPQVHLPVSRRRANVRGAFAVRPRADLDGASVLLVDDVTTTGATVNEATRTLLSAGVEHVVVAVLAKAEPPTAYSRRLQAQ